MNFASQSIDFVARSFLIDFERLKSTNTFFVNATEFFALRLDAETKFKYNNVTFLSEYTSIETNLNDFQAENSKSEGLNCIFRKLWNKFHPKPSSKSNSVVCFNFVHCLSNPDLLMSNTIFY